MQFLALLMRYWHWWINCLLGETRVPKYLKGKAPRSIRRILWKVLLILILYQLRRCTVDLLKLAFWPIRLMKISRQSLRFLAAPREPLVIIARSSANMRWLKFLSNQASKPVISFTYCIHFNSLQLFFVLLNLIILWSYIAVMVLEFQVNNNR